MKNGRDVVVYGISWESDRRDTINTAFKTIHLPLTEEFLRNIRTDR